MRQCDIRTGGVYYGKSGNTTRTVLAISDEYRPRQHIRAVEPEGPGVLFTQVIDGHLYTERLFLRGFAGWAYGEVGKPKRRFNTYKLKAPGSPWFTKRSQLPKEMRDADERLVDVQGDVGQRDPDSDPGLQHDREPGQLADDGGRS